MSIAKVLSSVPLVDEYDPATFEEGDIKNFETFTTGEKNRTAAANIILMIVRTALLQPKKLRNARMYRRYMFSKKYVLI